MKTNEITATKIKGSKTKKDAKPQVKTKVAKSKKPIATKVSKTKLKSSITQTPKRSEVILDYSRFGNIGFSTVHETVDISFLTKKKIIGRINALFHFVRNTEVCKSRDSGRTATFQIDGRPVMSITQKAGNYEEQVFTLTKYKTDGTKQSTRKYSYSKAKNLILDAFGFEIKIDEDGDVAEPAGSNVDMKIQAESGNFDDIE